MAQDSHDHHDHDDHEHAHGDHDDHHHEGPIVHTEVVPEKSAEDSLLLGVLSLCFVALLFTVGQWSFSVKADPHHLEGVEHEQTTSVEHAAPGHEVAPAAVPVVPTPVTNEATAGTPPSAGGNEGGNVGPGPASTPSAAGGVFPGPGPAQTGEAPPSVNGANPNPAWTGTPPADTKPAWTGTPAPAQPVTTPATTEANH